VPEINKLVQLLFGENTGTYIKSVCTVVLSYNTALRLESDNLKQAKTGNHF